MGEILALKDVTFYYKRKKDKLIILEHADVSFEEGKLYALLGKSGVGKSTTLSLLAGIDEPQGGKVLYDGQEMKSSAYGKYRRECVGMIFQDYCLLDYYTGVQNVLEGMAIAGKRRDLDSAYEILEKMGIRRDTADQNVKELSGGQKQRVAIARAVACQARIILADEPTGNLDEDTAGEIIELFQKLAHEEGICVIVVTHMRMLAEKADDVIRLENKSFFTS